VCHGETGRTGESAQFGLPGVIQVGDLRDGLQIETRVNGEVVQQGNTAQMIYGVGETLAHISKSLALEY
jgi:2-keto-4-pentenoate hydratase/2-oxohepta-3-ene-1,7-dioic acid hydratase in catechol pathway